MTYLENIWSPFEKFLMIKINSSFQTEHHFVLSPWLWWGWLLTKVSETRWHDHLTLVSGINFCRLFPVIEFLSDVFPCGLDPVGVVFMTESEVSTEDFDFINLLIGQLPVSLGKRKLTFYNCWALQNKNGSFNSSIDKVNNIVSALIKTEACSHSDVDNHRL